jgi:DnaJ-domain-containing protein 1
MADYYSILGVSKTANDLEIKAAFRRLAMIYHPDKNPNNPDAKQVFENVLKAYNTLIHPSLRRRYDQRGSDSYTHISKTQHNKRKTQKEWTFTEEELQRRQYYEKHYKAKQQEKARQHMPAPKAHSDYKYVLFATPIAVALLMLIISMFTETPATVPLPPKKAEPKKVEEKIAEPVIIPEGKLANGATPFSGYFGGVRTYSTENTLTVNNNGSYDAVIILFDETTNAYLQHGYVQADYSIEFKRLPDKGVYLKCMLGKTWDENKLMADKEAIGAFDSIVQFQNRKKWPMVFAKAHGKTETQAIDLGDPGAKATKYTSNEADFFAK